MKSVLLGIFAFGMILMNSEGFAQENGSAAGSRLENVGPSAKPAKVHTLDFEDELIEGGVQKPDLFYLIQRKNFNFKKLIRLRENFLPEMRETADYIREGRNKN